MKSLTFCEIPLAYFSQELAAKLLSHACTYSQEAPKQKEETKKLKREKINKTENPNPFILQGQKTNCSHLDSSDAYKIIVIAKRAQTASLC